MRKFIVATLVFLNTMYTVTEAGLSNEDFERFAEQYNKRYRSKEATAERKEQFYKNKATVDEMNERAKASGSSAKFAMNESGDLSAAEWAASVGLGGLRP